MLSLHFPALSEQKNEISDKAIQLASRSLQWVTSVSIAFLLFPFRLHFPAVLPLILYGQLPQWPQVGAEATFSSKSKAFLNDHPILDP